MKYKLAPQVEMLLWRKSEGKVMGKGENMWP